MDRLCFCATSGLCKTGYFILAASPHSLRLSCYPLFSLRLPVNLHVQDFCSLIVILNAIIRALATESEKHFVKLSYLKDKSLEVLLSTRN